jgi:hypothetical protein
MRNITPDILAMAPCAPCDSAGFRAALESAGPGLRILRGERRGDVIIARIEHHEPDEYGDTWTAHGLDSPWSDHWSHR